MAMPGLIDSHVHITFGDYTPRQKTVGFLESYIHGGVTTCISASEVHVPGRPRDPAGVKALAIAARKSFETLPPGRHARSCRLGHPRAGPRRRRFRRDAEQGVWLAKAGFGAFATPYDYAPYVAMAEAPRHGDDGAHRRLVDSRLDRNLGRSRAQDAAGRVVSRQRRADRHAGRRFPAPGQRERSGDAGLHRGQSAHHLAGREVARETPARNSGF